MFIKPLGWLTFAAIIYLAVALIYFRLGQFDIGIPEYSRYDQALVELPGDIYGMMMSYR